MLDCALKSGHSHTASAKWVLAYVAENRLQIDWILKTHALTDHLSGAHYLKERIGGRIAIGEHICQVQATFSKVFNFERSFLPNGSQFDLLFKDGQTFITRGVGATALLVPGHTPADMAYRVDHAVFVGDMLFMPNAGTAKADFPGGDAQQLHQSIQRILQLPP